MICNSILDAMGNTLLIQLRHLTEPDSARILVKFEGLNVGGSIKTRTAFNIIRDAQKKGLLRPDSIIVEPSSGNQGIGLTLVDAVLGYQVKIIMPDSVSIERKKLVEPLWKYKDCFFQCKEYTEWPFNVKNNNH